MRSWALRFCLSLMWPGLLWSAPVDLSAPPTTIGAADPYGHLSVWQDVAELNLDNGLFLPLSAKLSSDSSATGLLGYGFCLPLLEGRAYLLDRNTLKATLVCGRAVYLWRSPTDPHHFETPDKEWQGTLDDGNNLTMSRDDGWEMKYSGGKITELKTNTGRVLDWEYNTGAVQSIKEGGKIWIDCTRNADGLLESITVSGKKYSFLYDKRPRIEVINQQTLVAALEPSLHQITWPDGSRVEFTFGMTEERAPTVVVRDKDGSQVLYSWSPTTNNILTEGDWTYSVVGGDGYYNAPTITRKNSTGHSQTISIDNTHGITTLINDGTKTVYQTFNAPGLLFGNIKYITRSINNRIETIYRAFYNEKGQLIRSIRKSADGFQLITTFDDAGKILTSHVDGTDDPGVIVRLQVEEKALLTKLADAQLLDDRTNILRDLANFYMLKAHDFDKAGKAIAQIDRTQSFGLRLELADYNESLSSEEKIKYFKSLYDGDALHAKQLDCLIKILSQKHVASN